MEKEAARYGAGEIYSPYTNNPMTGGYIFAKGFRRNEFLEMQSSGEGRGETVAYQ